MTNLVTPAFVTRLWMVLFTLGGHALLTACDVEKSEIAVPPTGLPSFHTDTAPATTPELPFGESSGPEVGELSEFFNEMVATPAVEECCTSVGKMDECWWEDAIRDGITCTRDSDCPYAVAGACVKDTVAGSNLGVCRCRPGVLTDCYDPDNGKEGVCADNPDNPVVGSICGPSYCNGYLKCSCFGGCEWWDQQDATNTPRKAAEDASIATGQMVVCCEGNYPLGGDNIITYHAIGSCDPAAIPDCVLDADCDDGNPCTVDVCNGSNECEITNVVDDTVCGVDSDPTDCQGPNVCRSGVCTAGVNTAPVGTFCGTGADTAADDCVVGFQCDSAGACVETYEAAGNDCAIDETVYPPSCWDGFCGTVTSFAWAPAFDASSPDGICYEVMKPAPDNDTCAGAISAGDIGSFTNTQVGALPSVTGSTLCAASTSQAASMNCFTPAGVSLGVGAKDLVYSFGYTTTDATQQQLYGYVVTVAADFRATLYTETDGCTDGSVSGHPCQWQPELDSGGSPVPWEYSANNQGRNWDGYDQRCSTSGTSGYQWCSRTGGWEYPDDPVNCRFGNDGSYTCGSTASYVAQTFIYPISDESGTDHRVYIHVDGATAADEGNFTLTVERLAWQNGVCERVNDGPRVYDITDVSTQRIYRGNLEGAVNSDHSFLEQDCGGYACTATWSGTTSAHGAGSANEVWPNTAYFRIQPTSSTNYCIRTDHTGVSNGIDPVLEVVELSTWPANNQRDLCQGYHAPINGVPAAEGSAGVGFLGEAGKTYLVKLSERDKNTAACTGDCNYRMLVSEGICGSYCVPTVYEAEDLDKIADTYDGEEPPGWAIKGVGSVYTDHAFVNETSITVRARGSNDGSYWPNMTVDIGAGNVMNLMVTDTDYGLYTATFAPVGSTETVSVASTFDSWTSPGGTGNDVNLWVDYIIVGCDDSDTLVIEEQEGFCSVDGTIDSNNAGFTGDGFANTDNAVGKAVEWSVAASAGQNTYVTLAWNYANGGGSNRPGNLEVNGNIVGAIDFPDTGGWTSWKMVQTTVTLAEGTNAIRVIATTSTGLANINSLSVTGHGLSVGDCGPVGLDTDSMPDCVETLIEAESMNYTAGSALDEFWAYWIPSSTYGDYDFIANTSITVSAQGTARLGVWPNMVVKVGGVTVMDETVGSGTKADYTTEFAPVLGTRQLQVSFTNDKDDTEGDINLFVDNITLGCEGDGSGPVIDIDTDTSDDCIPAGCENAPTLPELDFTGWLEQCVYVPYDPMYHMSTWGWSYADIELIQVNTVTVDPGEVWTPAEMPTACNGGWYVYVNLNSYDSHVEVKP